MFPGLARGPSTLNSVATPSSRRTGAACRIAGWKRGARQNPIPALSTHVATPSGVMSRATPSASSTSADPLSELDARPPCLQTSPPAPATTNAAVVEMLIEWLRSPPVPQVQIARCRTSSVRGTSTENSRIAPRALANSSDVSPLVRIPMANAAICTGVALPRRISETAPRMRASSSVADPEIAERTPIQPPRSAKSVSGVGATAISRR